MKNVVDLFILHLGKIKLVVVSLLSIILLACSYSGKEDGVIRDRNLAYRQSESAVVLKVPPELYDNNIDDAYFIPVVNPTNQQAGTSLLPPGSLAAQLQEQELLEKTEKKKSTKKKDENSE